MLKSVKTYSQVYIQRWSVVRQSRASGFPPTVHEGTLPFLPFLPTLVCGFIDDSHSDRCEVISHCDFNLHFADEHLFMSIGHLYVLFGEVSVQILCPFFNWTICFFYFLVLSFISSI